MGIALLFPEGGRTGPGNIDPATNAAEAAAISERRIRQARQVLRHSAELAEAVRDGITKLDDALGQVRITCPAGSRHVLPVTSSISSTRASGSTVETVPRRRGVLTPPQATASPTANGGVIFRGRTTGRRSARRCDLRGRLAARSEGLFGIGDELWLGGGSGLVVLGRARPQLPPPSPDCD